MANESNFSFTTKIDGDLFTVRGDTPEQFVTNVKAATLDLIDYVAALQEAARGTNQTPTAPQQSGYDLAKQAFDAKPAPARDTSPPPARPAAPAAPSDGPTCHHGAMTYREGISGPNSKNPGTPYKMWVCPERNRDAQCKPVWVR